MKTKLFLAIFFLVFDTSINSQIVEVEENIISYYAVSNSLDGQPMIDMQNILRFYPIYVMRDSVTCVNVSIYYGKNIFASDADKMDNGKYWRVLLPNFKLGEAIQKIEVEVKFNLYPSLEHFVDRLKLIKKLVNIKEQSIENLASEIGESIFDFRPSLDESFQEKSKDISKKFILSAEQKEKKDKREYTQYNNKIDSLYALLTNQYEEYKKLGLSEYDIGDLWKYEFFNDQTNLWYYDINLINELDSKLYEKIEPKIESFNNILNVESEIKKEIDSLEEIIYDEIIYNDDFYNTISFDQFKVDSIYFSSAKEDTKEFVSDHAVDTLTIKKMEELLQLKEAYEQKIFDSIHGELTDSSHTGPSVQKSDLKLDYENYKWGSILYRNYKKSLRELPALDPAERLGIFRIRYVPFPMVGLPDGSKPRLIPFSGESSQRVFEIGLTFGDAIVPGDDFVVPEFSIKRLGIALALTEELFSDSAQIKAIALTYDFNSYASLGIGGNFAQNNVRGYASFGINQKAFQQLLKAIASIFN